MIHFCSNMKKKDQAVVESLIREIQDTYSDFYITKDDLRLFIKENIDLFFSCLKKNDKLAWNQEDGIAFIYGYSDSAKRLYLKILSKSNSSADRLIKFILQKINTDIYIKIKKRNPLRKILVHNNFQQVCGRGTEILLIHKNLFKEDKL